MSAREYGPDETWPSHQKPYWNKALAEARQAGWTLNYVDAPHRFGVVSCPAGEHTFSVDKTARGGETMSKEASKKVRRCQHGTGLGSSKVGARQEECLRLLGVADQLVARAAGGLTMAEAKRDAQEDLDRVELLLQSATFNVEEVLAEQETALQAAIDVDNTPGPELIQDILDHAMATVVRSESVAKAIRRPALARPLLERANKGRIRISELTSRVAALRERIHPGHG